MSKLTEQSPELVEVDRRVFIAKLSEFKRWLENYHVDYFDKGLLSFDIYRGEHYASYSIRHGYITITMTPVAVRKLEVVCLVDSSQMHYNKITPHVEQLLGDAAFYFQAPKRRESTYNFEGLDRKDIVKLLSGPTKRDWHPADEVVKILAEEGFAETRDWVERVRSDNGWLKRNLRD